MKILVTGAAGFIGSHLCDCLVADSGRFTEVVGIDNFDPHYNRSIKLANIEGLSRSRNFVFYERDLRDTGQIKAVLEQHLPDVVVHLAGKAGVRPSLLAPLDYLHANIEATVSLAEAYRSVGGRKLVFASSSSVYGTSSKLPFTEDQPLDHAVSIYAATKQSCESFLRMYANVYNFNVIALRLFTVYGPRQRPDLAIHQFLRANLKGDPITVYGDGSMARDYTYVQDTVQGILGAIARVTQREDAFEVYNLGNSKPTSLNDLIGAIEAVTGKKTRVIKKDVPLGDVPTTYANITKAQKCLGYAPSTDLRAGLQTFVEWLTRQPS